MILIDPTRRGERDRSRPEMVDRLQAAVIRQRKVRLTYANSARVRSERLIDPSAAMLDRARSALQDEEPEVGARVKLLEGPGEDATEILPLASFDGVLCHAVLLYVDDPQPAIDTRRSRQVQGDSRAGGRGIARPDRPPPGTHGCP